jgi:hypothetical protein
VIGVSASLVVSDTFRLTESMDFPRVSPAPATTSVLGEDSTALEPLLQLKAALTALPQFFPLHFVNVFPSSLKGI